MKQLGKYFRLILGFIFFSNKRKIEIQRILVFRSSSRDKFNEILKEASDYLRSDFNVFYSEENDSLLFENSVFDLLITDETGLRTVSKSKIKFNSYILFSERRSSPFSLKGYIFKPHVVLFDCFKSNLRNKIGGIAIGVNLNRNLELIDGLNLARFLSFRFIDGIDSLEKVSNKWSILLEPRRNLQVGRLSYSKAPIKVKGRVSVVIGNYCSFGEGVTFITENHDLRFPTSQGYFYKYYFNENHPSIDEESIPVEKSKGPIVVEHDVWIGDNVMVLSGVRIGVGASVAAGSIVTKDVKPFSIVAGVPARVIKNRFDDSTMEELKRIDWYNWSRTEIRENREMFFRKQGS